MNYECDSFPITGVGICIPDRILTNKEIESWNIGTNAEWIEKNIGVIERHISNETDKCYEFAIKAAQNALINSGLEPQDIDLIVTASVTADNIMPHTAAFVRAGLNAKNSICFDILASCAGFVYSIITAINLAKSDPKINNILVVASEMFSRITDWTDRKLCCAYGDGAGAFVISKKKGTNGILATSILHVDEGLKYNHMPAYYGQVPEDTSIIYRYSGREVLDLLKNNIPKVIDDLFNKTGWSSEELGLIVLPQTNKRMIEDILEEKSIPLNKTHMVMDKYGYTASSCLPITIYDALSKEKIQKGSKIIMVGAGLGSYFAGLAFSWY